MDHKELRKAIRKSLYEGFSRFSSEESQGDAMKAAQRDIELSGHKFEPVGKNKFEKDLTIDKLMADLESQEDERKSSLNEMQFIHTDPIVKDMEKRMDKSKIYTDKEFMDLFTQKHAVQHSKVMNMIKSKLKDKGFKFEGEIDEDSLAFRHKAGQRDKSREGVPLGQHAPHSQAALKEDEIDEDSLTFRHKAGQRDKSRKGVALGKHAPHSEKAVEEGAGISLLVKKGMNVKPTDKK